VGLFCRGCSRISRLAAEQLRSFVCLLAVDRLTMTTLKKAVARSGEQSYFVSAASVTMARGKPFSRQASRPPWSGRMCLKPFFLRSSATRALVASLGQVQ